MGIFSRLRGKSFSSKRVTLILSTAELDASYKLSPLPKLPLELWQRIFASVCRLPGTLQINLPNPFIPGGFLPVTKDEERSNARDRVNIQLVCKTWRDVCVEFAYADLVICCQKHILPLIDLLETTKQKEDDGGRGRWIRELEFRKGSCLDTGNVPEQFLTCRQILNILRCAPNLRIYRNRNDSQQTMLGKRTHRNILAALGRYCGRSLLRLEWSGSECPRWDDLEVLLHEVPNLQTLSCLHVYRSTEYVLQLREHRSPVHLRHLKTLALGVYPQPCNPGNPSWDQMLTALTRHSPSHRSTPSSSVELQLPSLQRLSLADIDLMSSSSMTKIFFNIYGKQLMFLHTSNLFPKEWYPGSDKWNSRNASVRDLLDLCTHLCSFIFNPMQLLRFPSSHSTLEQIALYPPSSLSEKYHPDNDPALYGIVVVRPVDDALRALSMADFPRLRSIRLNDTDVFEPLGVSDQWLEQWLPVWETKNVKFEDSNGLNFAMAKFDMEGMDF